MSRYCLNWNILSSHRRRGSRPCCGVVAWRWSRDLTQLSQFIIHIIKTVGSYSLLRIYLALSPCVDILSVLSNILAQRWAGNMFRLYPASHPMAPKVGSSQNNRYWLFGNIPHLFCHSSIYLQENPDLDVRLREVSPSSFQGWNQS